jgi:hypothetical protein
LATAVAASGDSFADAFTDRFAGEVGAVFGVGAVVFATEAFGVAAFEAAGFAAADFFRTLFFTVFAVLLVADVVVAWAVVRPTAKANSTLKVREEYFINS